MYMHVHVHVQTAVVIDIVSMFLIENLIVTIRKREGAIEGWRGGGGEGSTCSKI